jgi:hypothetical protein
VPSGQAGEGRLLRQLGPILTSFLQHLGEPAAPRAALREREPSGFVLRWLLRVAHGDSASTSHCARRAMASSPGTNAASPSRDQSRFHYRAQRCSAACCTAPISALRTQYTRVTTAMMETLASSRLAGVSARACTLAQRMACLQTALGKKFERCAAEAGVSRNERTRRSGSCCALIADCALPALLQALLSRHHVFEEILVLRREAFRESENLKAMAIADGPELDIG